MPKYAKERGMGNNCSEFPLGCSEHPLECASKTCKCHKPNKVDEEEVKPQTDEYRAIHVWLRDNYGKATKCEELLCLRESTNYEWSLLKGRKYERNRGNYVMKCRQCHAIYDVTEETGRKVSENLTGKKRPQEVKDKISRTMTKYHYARRNG